MSKIGILLILGAAVYLLYIQGYFAVQSKSAALFVGSCRGKKARFSACSGFIKRIVRFEESKTYQLVLTSMLTKGEMTVELLDANQQRLALLGTDATQCFVTVERKKRYYLIFRFQAATGEYELEWN